jgi:hypothetical protein
MRAVDEMSFSLELPYSAAQARERLQSVCDSDGEAGDGSGLRPLWGSVGDTWFRVRANRVGPLMPVAEGYVIPAGSGCRVTVSGEFDAAARRFARQVTWCIPEGLLCAAVGLAVPGARLPGVLVGGMFLLYGRWARWRIADAARRTRRSLADVLTGPPPSPAKWRPRLPERRAP